MAPVFPDLCIQAMNFKRFITTRTALGPLDFRNHTKLGKIVCSVYAKIKISLHQIALDLPDMRLVTHLA